MAMPPMNHLVPMRIALAFGFRAIAFHRLRIVRGLVDGLTQYWVVRTAMAGDCACVANGLLLRWLTDNDGLLHLRHKQQS